MDDPAVIAEARRRFAALLTNPDSLRGAARQAVLQIVADHADAATWEQLHVLAQKATDPTDRSRFYGYLGGSHDPALSDRALALALTKEPPATDAPGIIAAVSGRFPDKAFAFALAHRAEVDAMVEPTSRTSFFARLATGSLRPGHPAEAEGLCRHRPGLGPRRDHQGDRHDPLPAGHHREPPAAGRRLARGAPGSQAATPHPRHVSASGEVG